MTTARSIISGSLRWGLNALSPGEALDADLSDVCIEGLNSIVDEISGKKVMLWREALTAGTVTASTGTLGTTWATLAPGAQILSVSYNDGSQDVPLDKLTLAQYQNIPQKTQAGQDLRFWAHDGHATIYFYPVPTSRSVTLRTLVDASNFADLDTDYVLPKGYKFALEALLAERMAPSLLKEVPPHVARGARAARLLLAAFAKPAIIEHCETERANILNG